MTGFGPPVDGLRTIRVVLVCVALGVMMNTCGVIVSFFLNADRVDQINQERAQNVFRNCQDVNDRHDATIRQLDAVLKVRLRNVSLSERQRLMASRASTVALIDALAPKRDCALMARQQVSTP